MSQQIPNSKAMKSPLSPLHLLVHVVMAIYTIGFTFFRLAELASLFELHCIECATAALAAFFLVKWNPSSWYLVAIATMLTFVYICDDYLLDPLPPLDTLNDMVVVITGANSGIGFETAKTLVSGSNAITVIMACRSMKKCNDAADRIVSADNKIDKKQVIPMQMDLSDFDSVQTFAHEINQKVGGRKVDVLFNNAGYGPPEVEPVNKYGLDPSFTSMHISHHLLTELLIEQNPKLRVVATSSGTHQLCSYMHPSCIDEEYLAKGIYSPQSKQKYFTAKLANVMHVKEIPIHHPSSIAIAIDLGWVGTSIQPWMSGQVTPTSLGWMRSAEVGIKPVLTAILQPIEYFGDRDWSEDGGLLINTLDVTSEPFSKNCWRGKVSKPIMEEIGRKLWEKTTSILKQNNCL